MKKTILFFLAAFSMILFISVNGWSQNLLTNPGMEDWTVNGVGGPPDGWSLSGTSITAEQEATTIHGGTYSAKVTWTTTSTRYLQQLDIPVTAGQSYQFSFWALDNDPGGRARIAVRWYDSGGSFVSGYYGDYTVDSPDWQQLTSGSQQAPTGAVTAHAEVRVYDVSGGWTGSATVYVDDAVFENVSASPAAITNAYSVSSTDLEVLYDKDITTVDPTDYQLTGSAIISFSSATIDGTNAKLVHLSGGSPAMTADLTLDNILDDGNGTNFDFYAGISPISYLNTNNPGGTLLNGYTATFQAIVSANDAYNNVWISDAAGQYNGVLIYDNGFDALVAVGDEIIIAAERDEYNGLTELKNPVLSSTVSTGNTPYGPDIIPGSDIEYTIASNTNPGEAWEGQLVKIENVTVDSIGSTTYYYWCSVDISGTIYTFVLGDNVDYHLSNITLTVGTTYGSITGVVDWSNAGPYYRINPRNQLDIEGSVVNPATQLAITTVNGGVNPYTSTNFDVVVQTWDALGNPAIVASDINFTFTTNGGTAGNVDFVAGTTVTGTITAGTAEVTVTGVQMAPAGTNITITANDDNPFGLDPGTSAAFDVVDFSLPDIIITEVMQNPSDVGDTDGEWFEVFNNGDTDVDMNGWIIKDDGTNSHTISSSLIVPAHGFATLGAKSDPAINGGYTCDYQYSGFSLSNSDDEVVLVLPDGVTEVDRIEYDGGPVWPDPTGASMVFTGFPNEDNNDGTKWVWAALREASYVNSDTLFDKGSPGTDGYDQILTGGFKLDLKVYLEGPFNASNDSMDNTLRANGLVPTMQPFNPALPYYGNNSPAWLYAGTEEISYVQWPVVDWVLIELRDATSAAGAGAGTMIAQYPAFVTQDGTVVSLNGHTSLNAKVSITNNMYIVVWSRNHLGIMSSAGLNPVDGDIVTYDFSTGSDKVHGGAAGYKMLSTGIWGMVVGDINADKTIDATDIDIAWAPDAGDAGYKAGDLNFNGEVNNIDKNDFWFINYNISSSVPD